MSRNHLQNPPGEELWRRIVNRSMRFIMGIGVLSILIPALSMTVPGGIMSLVPWESGDFQSLPLFGEASDGAPPPNAVAPADGDTNDLGDHSVAPAQPQDDPVPPPILEIEFTTTTDGDAGSIQPGSSSPTTGDHPSTTSAGTGGGEEPPTAPISGDTLTGSVCPCRVTGTTELRGDISLKGDLMVDGGTLVARPGVNLDGNGFQIMFMNGGRADFQGTSTFTWSGNGSNANLARDVNFRNLRRIMFHEGAGKSILKYFTVKDSGTGSLGDYSIHFHMNGNSTRGTIVEGVVVVGSKNHAFVPHASHGITFRDTIAKNGKCEAYWWDPPEFQSTSQVNNSNDILYDHALADGVTNCPGDDRGFRLAAFELGAGSGNAVRDSIARNVSPSDAKDCSGFKWPELSDKQPSSWTFQNNASYGSKCNGIFVWQNDNEDHIVNGFGGDDGIDHGAYVNRYDYRNLDVPFVEVHALGWSVSGGAIDRVVVFRHSLPGNPVAFTNVAIGSFVVNNAENGGSTAGTYILNGTGLTCGSIVYQSVVPGTQVIIDGQSC